MKPKAFRNQVRAIAQELLPQALTQEVVKAHYIQLRNEIEGRLKVIEKQITETLTKIDERSKDIQTIMLKKSVPESEILNANTGNDSSRN